MQTLTTLTITSLALAGATLFHQIFFGDASAPASLSAAATTSSNSSDALRLQRSKPKFLSHRRVFLIGFALMSLGDWLQGPYLFAMYNSAGVSRTQQLDLYSFDFLLGAVLSICVGVASDLGARKWSCVVYGVLYGLSCLCNHFPQHFSVLALGCAVDGICNALLRCAFESYWAETAKWKIEGKVAIKKKEVQQQQKHTNTTKGKNRKEKHSDEEEAGKRDREEEEEKDEEAEAWISHALALSQWLSTVCSLLAGLACYGIVHAVDHFLPGGLNKFTATMDIAAAVLFAGSAYIAWFWESDSVAKTANASAENPKQQKAATTTVNPVSLLFTNVIDTIRSAASSILQMKADQLSLFLLEIFAEATLLLFICMYPALLHSVDKEVPFGFIFTQLMACLAVGSYGYQLWMSRYSGESHAAIKATAAALFVASMGFLASVFVLRNVASLKSGESGSSNDSYGGEDDSTRLLVVIAAMWMFEIAAGVYLSALGGLHEHNIVTPEVRASTVGICRMVSYLIAWLALQHQVVVPLLSVAASNNNDGGGNSYFRFATTEEQVVWEFAYLFATCMIMCASVIAHDGSLSRGVMTGIMVLCLVVYALDSKQPSSK